MRKYELLQHIKNIKQIIHNHRLDIEGSVYDELDQAIRRIELLEAGYEEIAVRDFVTTEIDYPVKIVSLYGNPIKTIKHVRGRAYVSETGMHDENDPIFCKPIK